MDEIGPQCAVCRHLGKPCDDTCILGPFFPLEKTEEFKCVHKFFGISNLVKIVSSVEENERKATVDSLLFEAQMRMHDKVHGSLRVKKMLEDGITTTERQLNAVNEHLRLLRANQHPSDGDRKGKRRM